MRGLLLSNQTFKIKPKFTDRLFYGQYQYCCKFYLNEIGVIRGLKINDIDDTIKRRNEWRRQGFYQSTNLISQATRDNLIDFCSYLLSQPSKLKLIASYNFGYVYTSDVDIVNDILTKSYVKPYTVTEAVVDRPLNTIRLQDPKWTHRTFFKERNIGAAEQHSLSEFLKSRTNLRVSPGLTNWMSLKDDHWNKSWLMSYYFVDHNNDGELLFLNMVAPGITGKTSQIIAK